MAHDLRPFRQYSENDVVNLYAYSGDSTLVTKGLVVKIMGDGFAPDTTSNGYDVNARLGSVGASYNNVVSQRYGATPKVGAAASGDRALGLTLMDIRETDENGEKLIFNPRKAAEMIVVVSGQAVPILTRGLVLINDIDDSFGTVDIGDAAYLGSNGRLATGYSTAVPVVGRFLSKTDENGYALVKVNFN